MWTRFVVVGCGGIGGWLIPPLFKEIEQYKQRVLGNKVEVMLVDGDKVEESNLMRQNFTEDHLGVNKAESFLPDQPGYVCEKSYIGEDNVEEIFTEDTVVLAGPDNHACRRILAEQCEKLGFGCLIVGGNEMFDGNVSCYLRELGQDVTQKYRDRHPEVWESEDDDRSTMSCDALSALPGGGQTLAANLMCATLMLNTVRLLLQTSTPLSDVYFDVGKSQVGGTA